MGNFFWFILAETTPVVIATYLLLLCYTWISCPFLFVPAHTEITQTLDRMITITLILVLGMLDVGQVLWQISLHVRFVF